MTARIWSWLGGLVIAAVATFAYGQVVTLFDASSWLRVGLFAVVGIAGTLSVFLFPQPGHVFGH